MRRFISICTLCLISAALYAQQNYKLTFKSVPEALISEFYCRVNDTRIDKENVYEYDVPAGATVEVRPRDNGYRPYDAYNYNTFREFTFEGEPVELTLSRNSTDRWEFIMPERDVTIIEHFDYTPGGFDNPNPGTNSWNSDTKTLIFDDVTSSYFDRIVPQEDRSLVERIIVSGTFFTNDTFHDLHIFPNLNWLDLTRTTLEKVSKEGRYSRYGYEYSNNFTYLTDIFLPATVKSFDEGCFEGTPIQNLTILALTPPQLATTNYWDGKYQNEYKEVAFDNPDMVVFVPAEAVPIYKADKWWGKYDIQPISGTTVSLVLNLMETPSDDLIVPYRNMTIEMENIHTGQVRRMLVTSRNTYTFRSLPVNTAYTIRLKTQLGGIVGQIDNVYIGEEDATATFASLLVPHNLKLNAWVEWAYDPSMNKLRVEKTSVNDAVTISWLDADDNPIAHGAFLNGVVSGQELKYVIKVQNAKKKFWGVPNEVLLKAQYVASDTVAYTVADAEEEDYFLQLLPLHRLGIYAYDPLIGYSYTGHLFEGSATQLVDGEAVNSYSILPREPYIHGHGGGGPLLPEGTYVVSVRGNANGPSQMSPESYALQTRTVFLNADMEQEFAMTKPTGNVIQLTAECLAAASVDGQGRISYVPLEAANISVRDVTHNRSNLTYSLNRIYTGGNIVLADTLQAGTKVEVSVSYNTANYEPQKATATVEHPDSIIPMKMTFKHKGNLAISVSGQERYNWLYGMLFDANGNLATSHVQLNGKSSVEDHAVVWHYDYTINSLQSGQYKLVLVNWPNSQHYMDRFHTMADVERLLTTGKSCMIAPVTIQDGIITNAEFDGVPYVGDLQFFLDGSNSRVSYSKDNIALGFMQTVKVNVAFQKEFSQRVSDVRLTFTRQGSMDFVNGSMMVGREVKSDYRAFASNSELPLADLSNQVKFCVMPQKEGEAGVLVRVFFKIDGVDYSETLPVSFFNVKAATITAPKIIAEPSLMVRGTTVADADVTVMNGDEVIGQAKSNAAGEWGVLCTLSDPINLETYEINAKIKISGTEINTNAVKVKYDKDEVVPNTVTMLWYNSHPVHMFNDKLVWDYRTGRVSKSSYDFSNLSGVPNDISFIIDLTNNDTTVVKAVTLTVFTSDHSSRDLTCYYDKYRSLWVTSDFFFTDALPTNVHVEVVTNTPKRMDSFAWINSFYSSQNKYNEYVELVNLADNAYYHYYRDEKGNPLVAANSTDPVSLPIPSNYKLDVDALVNGGLASMLQSQGYNEAAAILTTPVSEINNPYGPNDYDKWLADFNALLDDMDGIISKYDIPEYRIKDTDFSIINGLSDGSVTYTKLPSINHSALLVDGFVAMTLTDGSIVYRKQESDTHVALIYAKDYMRIDLVNNGSNARVAEMMTSIMHAPRKVSIYSIIEFINTLKGYMDELIFWIGKITDYSEPIAKFADATLIVTDKAMKSVSEMASYGIQQGWYKTTQGMQTLTKGVNKLKNVMRISKTCEWIKKVCKYIKENKGMQKLGKAFSIYGLISDVETVLFELSEVIYWYDMVPDPCEDDQAKANELKDLIVTAGYKTGANYVRKIGFDIANLGSEAAAVGGALPSSGVSLVLGGILKVGILSAQWVCDKIFDDTWKNARVEASKRLGQLECLKSCKKKGNCPKPDKPDDGDDDDDDGKPDFPDTTPIMDPSGFVYEAVESNRVEGATATVYYKETYKDMYGDEHQRDTQWDAENYGQVNPQTTDLNGEYGWMVPQGLWQVKFEKEGYETTYSEWLPVPPPQLDVNVEMKQMTQPQVKSVKAYEKGVQIDFDKYMQPETLTADNIFITRDNESVEGTLELVKAQEGSYGQTFAPAVRFIPNTPLATGQKVLLTVKSAVKSYAGIEMEEDFQQEFDVEKRVEAILADSVVNVVYGKDRTITVATQPADAAIGKKMLVECYSTDIATVDKQTLTLNAQGEAQLTVRGEMLGTTALRFTMEDDEDATAMTVVGVRDSLGIYVLAPVATRASGSEVYYGTKVQLTSNTHGATIYYTLDGSCPCDDNNPAVKLYNDEEGIVITQDNTTVKAMAIAPDMDNSDVETYTYYLRKNTAAYDLKKGWNWISHNQRADVATSEIVSSTSYVVDADNKKVTAMQPAVGYEAYVTDAKATTLTGTAWNPTTEAITVAEGWNMIGYPMNQVMTPDEAFAYAAPATGDIIVGQDGFAQYDGTEWKGSLSTLVPGKGYQYKAVNATKLEFNTTITSTAYLIEPAKPVLWMTDNYACQKRMPVIATVKRGYSTVNSNNFVIAAFTEGTDGDVCRGEGVWVGGLLFINVSGNNDENIFFKAFDRQANRFYGITEAFKFEADNKGTLSQPATLTIGQEISGIEEIVNAESGNGRSRSIYDLTGRKVGTSNSEKSSPRLSKGVYIINRSKVVVSR